MVSLAPARERQRASEGGRDSDTTARHAARAARRHATFVAPCYVIGSGEGEATCPTRKQHAPATSKPQRGGRHVRAAVHKYIRSLHGHGRTTHGARSAPPPRPPLPPPQSASIGCSTSPSDSACPRLGSSGWLTGVISVSRLVGSATTGPPRRRANNNNSSRLTSRERRPTGEFASLSRPQQQH